MFTSERTVDSARRESIVMLFNVIGVALASAFLTGQISWYVWKMQSIGWAPDRSSIMPVLGLLCGIVTLASLVAYLVIAWTSSPMVADRLARKSPYLLIVGTYWLFMVMTIAISRGALSTLNEGISRAVREVLIQHSTWTLIGFGIGLLSVSPVLLRPVLPATLWWPLLFATTILSLIEAVIALAWLLVGIVQVGNQAHALTLLVGRVPPVAWGIVGGWALAGCIYYTIASLMH
jgi:hypothetical protein